VLVCRRGRRRFALFNRFSLPHPTPKEILLVPGDNAGVDAGAEEFGLPEIRRKPLRTIEEHLKHGRASGATELKGLLPHGLSHT
jgi:hypothetical protein